MSAGPVHGSLIYGPPSTNVTTSPEVSRTRCLDRRVTRASLAALELGVLAGLAAGVWLTRNLENAEFAAYKITCVIAAGAVLQTFFSTVLPEEWRVKEHRFLTQLVFPTQLAVYNYFYRDEEAQWPQDLLMLVGVLFTTCFWRDSYDTTVEGLSKVRKPPTEAVLGISTIASTNQAASNTLQPEPFCSLRNLRALGLNALVACAGGGIAASSKLVHQHDVAKAMQLVGFEITGLGAGAFLRTFLEFFKRNAAIAEDSKTLLDNDEPSTRTKIFGRLDALVNYFMEQPAAILYAVAIETRIHSLLVFQGILSGYRLANADYGMRDIHPVNIRSLDHLDLTTGSPARAPSSSFWSRNFTLRKVTSVAFLIIIPAYFGSQAYLTYKSTDPEISDMDRALAIGIAAEVSVTYPLSLWAMRGLQRCEEMGVRVNVDNQESSWPIRVLDQIALKAIRPLRLNLLECPDLLGYGLATLDYFAGQKNMPLPILWTMLGWGATATTLGVVVSGIDRQELDSEKRQKTRLNPIATIFAVVLISRLTKLVKN